jgi:hypothetical protein
MAVQIDFPSRSSFFPSCLERGITPQTAECQTIAFTCSNAVSSGCKTNLLTIPYQNQGMRVWVEKPAYFPFREQVNYLKSRKILMLYLLFTKFMLMLCFWANAQSLLRPRNVPRGPAWPTDDAWATYTMSVNKQRTHWALIRFQWRFPSPQKYLCPRLIATTTLGNCDPWNAILESIFSGRSVKVAHGTKMST